jgi:hypothetical protein
VTIARIHCQVLEIPSGYDWRPRTNRPRDLLPWADPYIASLMSRLEDRYNVSEPAEDDLSDPFAPDDDSWLPPAGDDWEDAFVPRPLDAPRYRWHPPVYGGFPLLDDLPEREDGVME